MGFKADLENAEKNLKSPGKDQYTKAVEKNQEKQLEKPVGPPKDENLLKQYQRGKKDMEILLKMFSLVYCKQHVFVMGFGRKTKDSDPKIKAYCDGFVDRLLEGK